MHKKIKPRWNRQGRGKASVKQKTGQCRTEQGRAEQSRAERSRAEQGRARQRKIFFDSISGFLCYSAVSILSLFLVKKCSYSFRKHCLKI